MGKKSLENLNHPLITEKSSAPASLLFFIRCEKHFFFCAKKIDFADGESRLTY
jgi:hypothetical protein